MEYFQGRLLVEIVWPLLLFLILFLVRLRGLKKNHHECRRIFFLVLFIHCIGNILQVISRRRQCPQQDSSHSYRISSALITIPVTSLCGLSQAGFSNTTNLCKFRGKKRQSSRKYFIFILASPNWLEIWKIHWRKTLIQKKKSKLWKMLFKIFCS